MAQATILALGTTAASSSDTAVAAGTTISIFTDNAAGIPASEGVDVYHVAPSGIRFLFSLTGASAARVISGPATIRATRRVTTTNVGVFTET